MPKIFEIIYYLDSGARVSYRPGEFNESEQITDESMSTIIKLADGEELESIVSKFL